MQIELQNLQREVASPSSWSPRPRRSPQHERYHRHHARWPDRTFASPRELYDAPANRYVADFVGESISFSGEVVEASDSGG